MSTSNMTISVVIPAYNAAAYISRTLESVLSQTRPADEIIVVDDGSSDETADAVRSYGDRVKLIQQANSGASAARNAAIQAAECDWIAFLDADDEWLPEKLQQQIEHLVKHDTLVWTMSNYICCRCDQNHRQWVFDQGKTPPKVLQNEFYDDYFNAYMGGACGNTNTMLIQKRVLLEAGLFRPGQPRMNDEDMWFRIAYRYPRIGYLSRPLAIYHLGTPDSIVKKHNAPDIVIELINRHLKLAEQHGRQDVFRKTAESIAKMWIHWSWADQRIYQIRLLLKELGFLLPKWYKFAVYALTIWPRATQACMPLLRKMNKILKLPI